MSWVTLITPDLQEFDCFNNFNQIGVSPVTLQKTATCYKTNKCEAVPCSWASMVQHATRIQAPLAIGDTKVGGFVTFSTLDVLKA